MVNALFTFVGIIAGVVVTILVSRYYFRRSLKKSLIPYIQCYTSPLKNIDPTVRKQLEVKYQGHPIDNLSEIRFLIANTGDSPIRDIIEPLTLTVPEGSELLDASILHVSPKGRTVNLEISEDKKKIRYTIPLLNTNEFFITKILLDGSPKGTAFSFSISSDSLPPTLHPVHLPFDAIRTSVKPHFDFATLVFGLISLFGGLAVGALAHFAWAFLPDFNNLGFWGFIISLGLNGWATLVSILLTVLLLFFAVVGIFSCFSDRFSIFPKRKFIIPEDFNMSVPWRLGFPMNLDEEDDT